MPGSLPCELCHSQVHSTCRGMWSEDVHVRSSCSLYLFVWYVRTPSLMMVPPVFSSKTSDQWLSPLQAQHLRHTYNFRKRHLSVPVLSFSPTFIILSRSDRLQMQSSKSLSLKSNNAAWCSHACHASTQPMEH